MIVIKENSKAEEELVMLKWQGRRTGEEKRGRTSKKEDADE